MSRTLLITGASRGIGRRTAELFSTGSQEISDLILLSRPSEEFASTLADLKEQRLPGREVYGYPIDLADRPALTDVLAEIMHAHGHVDMLINNAGVTVPAAIHQIDFADFERTMRVNLYAPFTIVQELLHLGNTFELIVNVASTAGIKGRSGWLTYSASKAALINMSEVMREELAIYGTRVACISPGRCATDLRRTLAPDEDPTTIMQPEDVAAVIEMLASGPARFIDGANLVVRL